MAAPQHVYETFIRATLAEVWAAITQPEFTKRYFHNTRFESDLKPAGEPLGDLDIGPATPSDDRALD